MVYWKIHYVRINDIIEIKYGNFIGEGNIIPLNIYIADGTVNNAIAKTASRLAYEIMADGIVVFTKSGLTARRVSRAKPECPVYAVSPHENVLRRLAISWGVIPYYKSSDTSNADDLENRIMIIF